MADLLPSLSSDDEDGKIGNNYDDEEDDDENEEVDVVFGGLLVSSLERVNERLFFCEDIDIVDNTNTKQFTNLNSFSFLFFFDSGRRWRPSF